jgi:hypothetical protein
MISANHRFGLCITASAITLLCLLVAGLIIQVRASDDLFGKKPSVELQLSKTSITLPCPPGARSLSRSCPLSDDGQITLAAMATGFAKDASYSYSVGAGTIVGKGSKVLWDLTGVRPGLYVIKVDVSDSRKRQGTSSLTVTIANCGDCIFLEPCMFTLNVTCYDKVKADTPITCTLVANLPLDLVTRQPYTYQWSARDSDGRDLTATITKQGEYISIPTKELGGKHVITTVEVKELDPSCNRTASGVTFVNP